MAEKVEKLGVTRDKDFMYYVKDAAVWRVQRKQPGVPKGRPEKVADGTFQMDTDFIYFVDKDGDVSRAKRAIGGQKRKKSARKVKRASAGRKKAAKKPAAKKSASAAKGRGKMSRMSSRTSKGSKTSKKPAKATRKAAAKKKGSKKRR
jgi:hypothetical protein